MTKDASNIPVQNNYSETKKAAMPQNAVSKKPAPQAPTQAKKSVGSGDIGRHLLENKVISEDQLNVALKEQERTQNKKTIGAILVEMGVITEGALGEILNESSGIQKFNIHSSIIDSRLVKKVPKEFASRNKLIPVSFSNHEITIAMSDVFDIVAIDQVKRYFPLHFSIHPVYAPEPDIIQAIDQYYGYEMSIEGILREIEGRHEKEDESQLKGDYTSPMVRLVDSILTDAVHRGASDLHFEPEALFLRIRYRIDGKMVQIRSIHKDYWSSISVRIKIMSGMNIAENRKPQDGRINTEILGRSIDFRVSTQPTIHGENIVMRILDEKGAILSLDALGFTDQSINLLKKVVQRPEGVIIMTGPTGSGKTTTLYSMLSYINSIDKNIMTLEDPVEYRLPLIRQSNIRSDIGVDFASGIRTLLRQDPDVILVGEIRDKDTAITAIQAAMTGHQVFSSLHTNDAISAIPRLMNMGVPNYLMAGSLIAVIAQRLARKICASCKVKVPISDFDRKMIGEKYKDVTHLFKGKGCDKCGQSGYKGRVVISEIIAFDKELDELVSTGASRKEMFDHITKKGFIPIADDGVGKVVRGILDIKELMRVTDMTDRM